MVVVLPDRQLAVAVRAHPLPRDAHGQPVTDNAPTGVDGYEWGPSLPGAAKHAGTGNDDIGREWSLRIDPTAWPVRKGDKVTDGTLVWTVMSDVKLVTIPGYDDIDYVSARALLDDPEAPTWPR